MMSGPLAPVWENFFVTAAEASATLVGLAIVAISVNVQRILSFRHLPMRAGTTVASLAFILVVGMAALIPQPVALFGAETLALAIGLGGWQGWLAHRIVALSAAHERPLHEAVTAVFTGPLQVAPFVVGGALSVFGWPAGVYWIAAGIIATFACSVFNAWVFLVEILR